MNRNQVTLDRNTFGFENTRDTVILINDIKIELLTNCVQAWFVVCSQDLINAVCSQDFFNAVCSQDFINAVCSQDFINAVCSQDFINAVC